MTDPRANLAAKLGPLPVWLWGTIGAGAVILGRNLRGRVKAAASTGPASDAGGEPPAASAPEAGSSTGRPSLFPPSPANAYDTVVSDPAASTSPATNTNPDAWRRNAEQWALDNTQWSGIVITTAIRRYLDGAPLSYADASIVNTVIRAIGPSPTAPEIILQPGADPGNAPVPPNTTPVTPAPAAPKVVTVPAPSIKRGDRGAAVIELQQELTALGLDPGPVDGVYGAKTQAAVLRLQRMLGMTGTSGREYGPVAAAKLTAWKQAR